MNSAKCAKFFLFGLAMLTGFGQATAQSQDVSHCVDIPDPDDRLSCFDDAFVETDTSEPESTSDWNIRVERSKLDDSRTVFLSVASRAPIQGRFGNLRKGNLFIRCKENETNLFLVFGGHFMSDLNGGDQVAYRIDDKPAGKSFMQVSGNNEALGLWNGSRAIGFAKSLFGANNFYVRATPYSESPVEMEFNVTGLEVAVEPLREACGW